MDPVTLGLLATAAGGVISTAPKLLKTDLEKEQAKRLAKLKQREERGALGLTTREQAAIESRLKGGAEQVQRQAEQERARFLAGGGGAMGGQALAQAQAGEQQRMELETKVADKVLEADLAEKERELGEMYDLEAAQSEMKSRRRQAAFDLAGTLLEGGLAVGAQQAVIQGAKDISPESLGAVQNAFGVSESEARGIFELAATNPEILKLMQLYQGQ